VSRARRPPLARHARRTPAAAAALALALAAGPAATAGCRDCGPSRDASTDARPDAAAAGDAALAADAAADASPDGGAPSPFGPPFGPAQLLAALDDPAATEDDPSVAPGELEIFFNSDRDAPGGPPHLWYASRAALADPFGPPVRVEALVFTQGETTPELAPDGLGLHFAAALPGGTGGLDLYFTARPAPGSLVFGAPIEVAALDSPATDDGAALRADGLEVFFASDRAGTLDVWRAARAAPADPWGAPAPVAGVSGIGVQGGPALSADARVLYFHGETTAPAGVHLWRAARADGDAAFGPPELAADVNDLAATDLDPDLSADGSALYFASTRDGSFALYVARR
jgi:hypothetical protein